MRRVPDLSDVLWAGNNVSPAEFDSGRVDPARENDMMDMLEMAQTVLAAVLLVTIVAASYVGAAAALTFLG